MSKTRAADYKGVEGLYIPPEVSDLVINDIHSTTVLSEICNPNFSDLNSHTRTVHYHMIEDYDLHINVRHQVNGERIQLPSPFRNGTIEMCYSIKILEKFARDEAYRLNRYWELHQDAREMQIANLFTKVAERNVLHTVAALTRPENQGNKAGLRGSKIYLGDSNKPLNLVARKDEQVTDFNVTATEVVNRLDLAWSLGRSACPKKDLRVVASPYFTSKLRAEQANAMRGGSCCIEDKPEISGILSNTWGFPILETPHMPVHYMADGTMIEYVMLINPNIVAAPLDLLYLEWQPDKHDIYLVGDFYYGAHLLSSKGAAIAAVKYSA